MYPRYVLALLLAGYVMNSLDRAIISVLLEPIGREFNVSDTQLGFLSGLAFAAVFSTLGILIAALADRTNRRNVLAVSILVWSVATICCGMAGSFALLLLARIGTAAGEAGGTPASHSIISDYFPPQRRATAMATFALGAPLGTAFAGLWGAYGNDEFGWRTTIMLAGLPGLVLAPLIWLTIQEQPRTVPAVSRAYSGRTLIASLRCLTAKRSFVHLFIACAVHSVAVYSTSTFNATYLIRSYGWEMNRAGSMMALLGVLGAVGTFLGGAAADRLSQRKNDPRWLLWVPAFATFTTVPFLAASYLSPDPGLVLFTLPMAAVLALVFFGPSFALAQSLAEPGTSALAASTLLFGMAMIGLGVGPMLVGAISDWLLPSAGEQSLRYALLLGPMVNIWSTVHFLLAVRTLSRDLG